MIKHYIALLIISMFMIGAVVYGFLSGGSPWEARNRKFDETRISNLREIKYAVESYFAQNKSLPENLSQVKDNLYGDKKVTDPESGIEYEYKTTGRTSYQLCTTFNTNPSANETTLYRMSNNDDFANYQKGPKCFDIKVTDYNNNSNEYLPPNNQVSIQQPLIAPSPKASPAL